MTKRKKRQEFSASVRTATYERCGGKCEGCGRDLQPNCFQYDHILPDGLGGEPTLENCQVLCTQSCHHFKTHIEDRPRMAKADRVGKKWRGEKVTRNPLPGSKRSKWKRKLNGTVVKR